MRTWRQDRSPRERHGGQDACSARGILHSEKHVIITNRAQEPGYDPANNASAPCERIDDRCAHGARTVATSPSDTWSRSATLRASSRVEYGPTLTRNRPPTWWTLASTFIDGVWFAMCARKACAFA